MTQTIIMYCHLIGPIFRCNLFYWFVFYYQLNSLICMSQYVNTYGDFSITLNILFYFLDFSIHFSLQLLPIRVQHLLLRGTRRLKCASLQIWIVREKTNPFIKIIYSFSSTSVFCLLPSVESEKNRVN